MKIVWRGRVEMWMGRGTKDRRDGSERRKQKEQNFTKAQNVKGGERRGGGGGDRRDMRKGLK
jgi:hypothetical protein